MRAASATTTTAASAGFVPIVTEAVPVTTVPHTSASVIEVRLAGAVVRVVSGMDDTAQLTAVLRAVRASATRI
jgi:hypothetical protein